MEVGTGGKLVVVDPMRRAGRHSARGLAFAALTLLVLKIAACGGSGGASTTGGGSVGDSCAGALGPGLFFAASDGASGVELWKTNGTDPGTVCVKNINPGAGSGPLGLTVFNGALYFLANDGASGEELWKSDGTVAGTALVNDIYPGPVGSSPFGFTVFNGALYFAANDGSSGFELWKTDSTGTMLVKDIKTGLLGSSPSGFTVFNGATDGPNGALYFSASDGAPGSGFELWKTNGTAAGTVLVKNWAVTSFPSGSTVFHGA